MIMTQYNFHEKDATKQQMASSVIGLSRTSKDDSNLENSDVENTTKTARSPRKFSNNKNRIIGFVGAILIGLMVYNLLTNYLGLV